MVEASALTGTRAGTTDELQSGQQSPTHLLHRHSDNVRSAVSSPPEGERARGREGERARGREGERARGREGERARGREDEPHGSLAVIAQSLGESRTCNAAEQQDHVEHVPTVAEVRSQTHGEALQHELGEEKGVECNVDVSEHRHHRWAAVMWGYCQHNLRRNHTRQQASRSHQHVHRATERSTVPRCRR